MNDAIIAKPKSNQDSRDETISDDRFKELIRQIYDVMLAYTRVRGKALTKTHPIQIGNATFWFDTDIKTGKSSLSFEPSLPSWKEELVVRDIDLHTHDLYYGAANGLS